MSVERFLLVNFMADFLLLLVCVRAVGRVRPLRLFFAALIGTLYAILSQLPDLMWLKRPTYSAFCLVLLGILACPSGSMRKYMRLFAHLFVFVGMAGGLQLAFGYQGFNAPFFLAAVCLFLAYSDSRRRIREMRFVFLRITVEKICFTVRALVDTGNCLHEPLSGLPALIISHDHLCRMIGEDALNALKKRAGTVRYRSIDSCGEMPCVPVDKLEMLDCRSWKNAPDVCLAISEHSFSREHQLIAPVGIFDDV